MTENLNAVRSIRTISGQYVNVFEPNPDTLLISDIAHALSHQCRFGGHLPRFYSVAQHSLLCYLMAKEDEKFDALMHDASEAYLLDMPKPIKVELSEYNAIEDNLMNVLAKKFGFNYPKSPEVERVDILLLNWEWEVIMLDKKDSKFGPIDCMTPEEAKREFLRTFEFEVAKRKKLQTV
jgi:uncharacterized protein